MALNKYRNGKGGNDGMLSPVSSPEKMDISEEDNSLDQSPLSFRLNSKVQEDSTKIRKGMDAAVLRRRTCPPRVFQHVKTNQKGNYSSSKINPIRSVTPIRRSSTDISDINIDREFGSLKLYSPIESKSADNQPYNNNLATKATASATGSVSATNLWSLTSSKKSAENAQSKTSENVADNAEKEEDSSNVTTNSSNAQHTQYAENNESVNEETNYYIPKMVGSKIGHFEFSDDEDYVIDDKVRIKKLNSSDASTAEGRAKTKANARKSNRCGQFLCYMHSIELCLVLCVLGYFGSLEMSYMWCGSSLQFNVTQLELEFEAKVYGQHIAVSVMSQSLSNFFKSDAPEDASIVYSFHGWTGIGKNYISTIISDLVPSSTVQKLIIPLHFPHSGEEYNEAYQSNVEQWILGNITQCSINIFIIDEMDKASTALITGLHTAIRSIKENQWNNTKIIFLILSNTAGSSINKVTLEQLKRGVDRLQISQELMQDVILSDQFARWHKDMHSAGLIDHVIPFLPLQFEHLVKCIESYLLKRNESLSHDKIMEIAKQFDFFPRDNPTFSKTGCKRVTAKTDLYLE